MIFSTTAGRVAAAGKRARTLGALNLRAETAAVAALATALAAAARA